MKNNSLDDIVKCSIDISNPVSSNESFGKILLIADEPKSEGANAIASVIQISKSEELSGYGYSSEDAAYIAAEVAFSQNPAPSELYLCVRKKVEAAYEDISSTLQQADSESGFYGFCLVGFDEAEDIQNAAEWAEEHEKLFGFNYSDIEECPITDKKYYRTFGLFSGKADGYDEENQPEQNQFAALGLMAKCFGYNPGSETWHLKDITGVVPSVLNDNEKDDLAKANVSKYLTFAGSDVTIGGMVLAGEWIDVIRFRDWLKSNIQKRVFHVMKSNPKVPFSDSGIGLIEGAVEAALLEGQTVGGIAQSEYDDYGNETPGFTVKAPKASEFTEAERKSRKATGFRYSAKLAGAIHLAEISGYLTF